MGDGLRCLALVLVGLVLGVLTAAPAMAQWQMIEEVGPNGQPAYALRSPLGGNRFVQVWCSGNEQEVSLLNYDGLNTTPEASGDVVAMIIQSDTGRSWQSPADFYRHAPDWVGLRYRNSADARAIVEDIIAAKASVAVVMRQTVSGQDYPYSASAKGSTSAGKAFVDKCFGARVEPVLSLSAWGVRPGTSAGQTTLLGDLDQGGYFYAYCSPAQALEVGFLSTNPATFPYEARDVGLMLRVEIDGEVRSATGEPFTTPEGRSGIRYAAPEYTESLLAAVGAARSDVAITIESYSNGIVTRWPAKNLNGLAQSVAQFKNACSGSATVTVDAPVEPLQVVPPAPGNPEWMVVSTASESMPDHMLTAPFDNGKGSILFACDVPGEATVAIQLAPDAVFGAASSNEALHLYADDKDFLFIAEGWEESGSRFAQSTNQYQIADAVIRMAIGVQRLSLALRTSTGGELDSILPTGPQAVEAAKSFARNCLTEDDFGQIEYLPLTEATGWDFVDGEAAAMLNSLAVLRAPATGGGRIQISCFAETGAHQVAFFSDDYLQQEALQTASRFELALFVGEAYWPLGDATFAASLSDLGIGSTDQKSIGQVLRVLAAGPAELTISTRTNFNDFEPHKVLLADASAVAGYLAVCPAP